MKRDADPIKEADAILEQIRINQRALFGVNADCTLEVTAVTQKYAALQSEFSAAIKLHEKALERLVRKHRDVILAGKELARLPGGSVMLRLEKRVKRIKGMLERLREAGLQAAIKYAKAFVDWDLVEKFPDEDLERLGTERVEKEKFSYEIRRPHE